MNRYSVIEEKNPREIILLRSHKCKWGRCFFCDYIHDNMSDESRENLESILNSSWNMYLSDLEYKNSITKNTILNYSNNYNTLLAKFNGDSAVLAKKLMLVDDCCSKKNALYKLGFQDSKGSEELRNLVDYYSYYKIRKNDLRKVQTKKVALLYFNGVITSGVNKKGVLGSDSVEENINRIIKDKDILGVIIRINSGGGSSYDSEVIRRSISLLSENSLPVVVSMGNVAASGAYWASMASDYVIANKFTITGSIGAFGMFPTAKELLEDHIGLTFDNVKTAKFADSMYINKDLSEEEIEILNLQIDDIYNKFIDVVSIGRGLKKDYVKNIAEGRVYTGSQALDIKLVDEIGTMYDAKVKIAEILDVDVESLLLVDIIEKDDFKEIFMDTFMNTNIPLDTFKILNDIYDLQDRNNVYTYYPTSSIFF